jgi:hypothetical protein
MIQIQKNFMYLFFVRNKSVCSGVCSSVHMFHSDMQFRLIIVNNEPATFSKFKIEHGMVQVQHLVVWYSGIGK